MGAEVTPLPVPEPLRQAATSVFGDALPAASRFAGWLAGPGIERGLLGPREAPRVWDRHLLNCAVVDELLGEAGSVIDVGSGAGLPGLAIALLRPDLRITLVEPLLRRATFLSEVVAHLELASVEVLRCRAEDCRQQAQVVTSRALAPLDRLAAWSLPLTLDGGRVLAIKGSSAGQEILDHGAAVSALGGRDLRAVECGNGVLPDSTTVITMTKAAPEPADSAPGRMRRRQAR